MKTTRVTTIDQLSDLIANGDTCVLFDDKTQVPRIVDANFDKLLYVLVTSENAHEFQVSRIPQLRVYHNGVETLTHVGTDYNAVLNNLR